MGAAFLFLNQSPDFQGSDLEMSATETIFRAACMVKGEIYEGFNHFEAFMVAVNLGRATTDDYGELNHQEGFTTSTGRFVDREEAYQIALRAQQCAPMNFGPYDAIIGKQLLAENVF